MLIRLVPHTSLRVSSSSREVQTSLLPAPSSSSSGWTPRCSQARWESLQLILSLSQVLLSGRHAQVLHHEYLVVEVPRLNGLRSSVISQDSLVLGDSPDEERYRIPVWTENGTELSGLRRPDHRTRPGGGACCQVFTHHLQEEPYTCRMPWVSAEGRGVSALWPWFTKSGDETSTIIQRPLQTVRTFKKVISNAGIYCFPPNTICLFGSPSVFI